jgi:hypothetical protein
MSTFEAHNDDVVSMDPSRSLVGSRTFKVKEFDQGLKGRLRSSVSSVWFEEGVECELLKTTGGGWQKGKIRIREICIQFEFVPDVPDEPDPNPDSSFLDSLRTDINPDQP